MKGSDLEESVRAYHFLRADMTTVHGDELPWTVGETRTINGPIGLCHRGYHAAPSWWDALSYAPGPVACVVELSGELVYGEDKMVAQRRKLIAAMNVERQLREFACDCAERALNLVETNGQKVDPRSREAIMVARRFATGQASMAELAGVRHAAYLATDDASCYAYTAALAAADAAGVDDNASYTAYTTALTATLGAANVIAYRADSATYFAARDAAVSQFRAMLAVALDEALGAGDKQ